MAAKAPSAADIEAYYAVLGLEPGASDREIASAYRARALRLHPDKNRDDPAAEARFHALLHAYQVLGDPEARRAAETVARLRRERAQRAAQLDDERRRLQEDLLGRERDARRAREDAEEARAEAVLRARMEALRREEAAARGASAAPLGPEEEALQRTLRVTGAPDAAAMLAPYEAAPRVRLQPGGAAALVTLEDTATASAVMEAYRQRAFPAGVRLEWALGHAPQEGPGRPAAPPPPAMPGTGDLDAYEARVLARMHAAQARRRLSPGAPK